MSRGGAAHRAIDSPPGADDTRPLPGTFARGAGPMDATYADPTFVFAAVVVFAATFVCALTGFGAALVLVPLLSLVWDLRQVVLLTAIVQATTGFPVALAARKGADRAALVPLLAGSICGLVPGAFLLAIVPPGWLRRGLGVLTLLFGLSRFTPIAARVIAEPGRRLRLLGLPVGFGGGLLTGMIGTGGPPIVAYLQFRLATPAARRATLLVYFMALDLVRLPTYLGSGLGSRGLVLTAVALIPFAILGTATGGYAHGRLGQRVVSDAIAILLVLTGVSLLAK
jgi:uncharacterized membrane protein YfcA